MSRLSERQEVQNAILAAKSYIMLGGRKVILPAPQVGGTYTQKQTDARMSAEKVLERFYNNPL
jgi:hypothetical protein